MLKSEKLRAGPLMSVTGATIRMFSYGPWWLKWFITPLFYILWLLCVSPFYYLGLWVFFRHGLARQRLVDAQRHRELLNGGNQVG